MLNIGIRCHDFGVYPVETLAPMIAEQGFSHIQLAPFKAFPGITAEPGRLSPGFASYIRETLARHSVTVSILGCYINPINPDRTAREREIMLFKEYLRYARDFGCSVVATETGSCGFPTGSEPVYQEFLKTVGTLVDTASRFGVTIGLEGVWRTNVIGSHERMVRTLETIDSPNLQVVYDPVNFLPEEHTQELQKNSMREAFEMFGDRIVAVHAKDFIMVDGKKKGTLPAGKGLLDYRSLFSLLKKKKPYIHVLLENTDPATMIGAADYVGKMYEQAEG